MKKTLFTVLILACFSLTAKSEKLMDSLKQDDSRKICMELEINQEAKESQAFISWELNGDWDLFDYQFSQGILEGNLFTIKANEYKDFVGGEEGIALTFKGKPKTESGNYNLKMTVQDVSDELDFPKDGLNLDMDIVYLLPPPPPIWKRLLVPAIILMALVLILLLVMHLTAKFPKGLLQLGRDEISLKGKKVVSVRKELEKLGTQLEGDSDVIFIKKRFGSFQGPVVKEMKGCSLELNGNFISRGTVLHPDEELHGLKDGNGDEIIIRYC